MDYYRKDKISTYEICSCINLIYNIITLLFEIWIKVEGYAGA